MFPIHSGTAQTIANVFRKEILTRWVVPDILISDRGTEFVSEISKKCVVINLEAIISALGNNLLKIQYCSD